MQPTFLRIRRVILAALLAMVALQTPAADPPKVTPLLTQALPDGRNQELIMLTVEYGPGQSSPPHRHNADTFVYVLEGALIMGVKGKEPVRVAAGQTFHESVTDVHNVSRNASDSAPARFLVVFVHEKGKPTNQPADASADSPAKSK